MKVAYWPRFSMTSRTSSLRFVATQQAFLIRASRLRRASRKSAVSWKTPNVGIEPSRSSHPRWPMK